MNPINVEYKSLTDNEKKVYPYIIELLSSAQCYDDAITGATIAKKCSELYNIRITGPSLRRMIRRIRVLGEVDRLIASPKGYWVESNEKKIHEYIDQQFYKAESFIQIGRSLGMQLMNPSALIELKSVANDKV